MRFGVLFAVVALASSAQISASAQLELPELPLPTASPTDTSTLEDLLDLDGLLEGDAPVSTDVNDLTGALPDVLGGSTPPKGPAGGTEPPGTKPPATQAGWPSTDRQPAPEGLSGPPVRTGSTRFVRPSYGAAVGDGFARAARRAADLAGPVAAPMLLGIFAVGVLFVAARGPGRLIKVEEERKAFREQRTFRL